MTPWPPATWSSSSSLRTLPSRPPPWAPKLASVGPCARRPGVHWPWPRSPGSPALGEPPGMAPTNPCHAWRPWAPPAGRDWCPRVSRSITRVISNRVDPSGPSPEGERSQKAGESRACSQGPLEFPHQHWLLPPFSGYSSWGRLEPASASWRGGHTCHPSTREAETGESP